MTKRKIPSSQQELLPSLKFFPPAPQLTRDTETYCFHCSNKSDGKIAPKMGQHLQMGQRLLACACGKAFYCNQLCQISNWKEHQNEQHSIRKKRKGITSYSPSKERWIDEISRCTNIGVYFLCEMIVELTSNLFSETFFNVSLPPNFWSFTYPLMLSKIKVAKGSSRDKKRQFLVSDSQLLEFVQLGEKETARLHLSRIWTSCCDFDE